MEVETKEDHNLLRAASREWGEIKVRGTYTWAGYITKIGPALVAAKRQAEAQTKGKKGSYSVVMSAFFRTMPTT